MADNTAGLGDDLGRALKFHIANAGKDLAESFTKAVKQEAANPSSGFAKQLLATGVAGAVTGAGAGIAGTVAGGAVGSAAGAAGTLATGAVSAAAAAGPAGAAAAGLVAVAGAAKLAADSAKGFAAAASPNGMKSVDSAFSIFTAAIGQKLLPAFVMLGASALVAADVVGKQFVSTMDAAAMWWTEKAPMFEKFGHAVGVVTDWIIGATVKLANWLSGATGGSGKNGSKGEFGINNLTGETQAEKAKRLEKDRVSGNHGKNEVGSGGPDTGKHPAVGPDGRPVKDEVGPGKSAGGGSPATKPGSAAGGAIGDIRNTFVKGFGDIVKDMEKSMGSNAHASTGGLEDAWKKAQAGVGGGLEAEQRKQHKESLDLLKAILKEMTKGNSQPPPFVK